MKTITLIALISLISMSGWAQVTMPVEQLPSVFYGGSNTVLDGNGDLFVFNSVRGATGVGVTGLRHSFFAPQTSVTMQVPGTSGNIQSVTYPNTAMQIIGTGTAAVYAIATVYMVSGNTVTTASSLIAFVAGQALPASLSGLHPFALTAPVDAKVGPSDYLSLVTQTAATSMAAATRTATVVHFDGTSFHVVSSGTLP